MFYKMEDGKITQVERVEDLMDARLSWKQRFMSVGVLVLVCMVLGKAYVELELPGHEGHLVYGVLGIGIGACWPLLEKRYFKK